MTLLPKDQRTDSDALSEKEFDTLLFSYLEGCSDDTKLQKLECYLREPFYIRRFAEQCWQDLLMYQLASTEPAGKSPDVLQGFTKSRDSFDAAKPVITSRTD